MFNRMLLSVLAACLLVPGICHADSYSTYFAKRPSDESYRNVTVSRFFTDNAPSMCVRIDPEEGTDSNFDFALVVCNIKENFLVALGTRKNISLKKDNTIVFKLNKGETYRYKSTKVDAPEETLLTIGTTKVDQIDIFVAILTGMAFNAHVDNTNIRGMYYLGPALRYLYEIADVWTKYSKRKNK